MDNEMIAEVERAYQIASQYTTNIIRIRRLLEQSPITINDGQAMINEHSGRYLIHMFSGNNLTYVNPILKVS